MSARPLEAKQSLIKNDSTETKWVWEKANLPYLSQNHGLQSGLHEESFGLAAVDEAIDGLTGGELLSVALTLNGGD